MKNDISEKFQVCEDEIGNKSNSYPSEKRNIMKKKKHYNYITSYIIIYYIITLHKI